MFITLRPSKSGAGDGQIEQVAGNKAYDDRSRRGIYSRGACVSCSSKKVISDYLFRATRAISLLVRILVFLSSANNLLYLGLDTLYRG